MARTKISEFSATAADNTDIDNIDIAEGCAPSGINNAIRELMAQLKDFQTGAAGDPFNGAVNGTLGATTPAAATITNLAYTGTLTGGTGVINIGSGQVIKDAAGNLGLGVTPSAWSSGFKALEISGGSFTSSSNANVLMFQNAYFNGTSYIYNTSAQASYYRQQAGEHRFYNAPSGTAGNAITFTQAMTLTAAGQLLCGVTSAGFNPTGGGAVNARGYAARSGLDGSFSGNGFNINWTGNPVLWIDSTNVGTLATTSDYRTKKNITTQTTPALERVMQLRPVNYELADYGTLFKADGVAREGFIAHELAEVIPSAVEGEKDAENQIQSLKLDALCSVLTKAIQELKAEFDAYKAAHP